MHFRNHPASAAVSPENTAGTGHGSRYLHARRQTLLLELLATRGYEHLLLLGGEPALLFAAGACAREITATGIALNDDLTAFLRGRRLRATLIADRPDPAALPFADNAFDGLLLPDGLESAGDLEAAAAGLARVCRAGGVLVAGSPVTERLAQVRLPFFRRGRPAPVHGGDDVLRAMTPHFRSDRLVTFPPIMPVGHAMFYLFRCVKAAD